jgi:hypothetical protein
VDVNLCVDSVEVVRGEGRFIGRACVSLINGSGLREDVRRRRTRSEGGVFREEVLEKKKAWGLGRKA